MLRVVSIVRQEQQYLLANPPITCRLAHSRPNLSDIIKY